MIAIIDPFRFALSLCCTAVMAMQIPAQEIVPAVSTDESQAVAPAEVAATIPSRRHALIVVGLPGDQAHRERFDATVRVWRDWMVKIAGVDSDDILVLDGREASADRLPATQENIRSVTKQLVQRIRHDESLWVFWIGHGNQDRRHGWFHLPGPDLNAAQWAAMFAELKAGEQVFWLTHSASGSFLKPFSLPGRIVISATDDGEINETRFPRQLADIMTQQLTERTTAATEAAETVPPTDPAEAPAVSVLELFRRTADQVGRSFDEDHLLPTEHAMLDDNGDGVGTEVTDLATIDLQSGNSTAAQAVIDGLLAAETIITTPEPPPTPDDSVAPTATQKP
ncbi:hypothetical protein Enr13x_27390 [Stieleria neptunia]|uniref:Caspase domain protein n=1 Tax=Stieleria neptunia TaxID=2527979 RepID=A0A518HPW5_9BACT|nr:hypothetical protein [Stieleria neptunia]QDV42888.1 hypothetical protein Enr13x_27390 [Stieleria neptunia]